MSNLISESITSIIELAIHEDHEPYGDLSSFLTMSGDIPVCAQIIAKQPGMMCCGFVCELVLLKYFEYLKYKGKIPEDEQADFKVDLKFNEGEEFAKGQVIIEIETTSWLILGTERIILNLLQKLIGVCNSSHEYALALSDSQIKLLDTRKTTPGLRFLEKLAFSVGGNTNHRLNLSDMLMLKENHLALTDLDLADAISSCRAQLDEANLKQVQIEVEINPDNLSKLQTVCEQKVDIIMLDNFEVSMLEKIVNDIKGWNSNLKIELSGNITLENLKNYKNLAVDFISSSTPILQARPVDLSMLIEKS
jgi:nicotinate-nucleotide pyrophosphorylase (carboxylating)